MHPEVQNPIITSPYEEPKHHWKIHEHEPAEKIRGRRTPTYMYLPPGAKVDERGEREVGYTIKLQQVMLIRERLAKWREEALRGEGGISRVSMDLMKHWRREGRAQRLFFAQLEAAETVIFLTEARPDFLQGIDIPLDQPGADRLRDGFTAFRRLCCKMATGAGKTTVMAMLAAWSILNKTANKSDARFSDAVLVVCPNVTIRDRLLELDPQRGEASIYRTRDLVPDAMMPQLAQGRVRTVNWHVFEPRGTQGGARVSKAGRRVLVRETVHIGDKTTTARGKRYMRKDDLEKKDALGLLRIVERVHEKGGELKKALVESEKYIETDAALVGRVLSREFGARRNILVFNDEAHHAYRLRDGEEGADENAQEDALGEEDAAEHYYREATVWVDGLDKVHKLRGINFCADFSATPYFLGKAGKDTNRIFPWTVSDFGLQDAIEAGLVKIPQMAARDSSGASVPGYFNIWKWILPQLSASERGGRKSGAKPEAILKYAHTPVAMLGGMWEAMRRDAEKSDDPRPPVFILVCKTKKLAKVVYEWLAEDRPPSAAIPRAGLPALRNSGGAQNTICVYSDVQNEIDSGNAKSDENRWMRHVLDTIGKTDWPRDRQRRAQYPDGFETLAEKLGKGMHPPGRDVRCIVSVGMLTEGWDCSTVTHIIGLRPFMSQLLCEQVVGRGLRRASYEVGDDGLMREEIATVLGVPLSAFTLKASGAPPRETQTRHHVRALPAKAEYEIRFPRVEGYRQPVHRRINCDMSKLETLQLDGVKIPPEVEMRAGLAHNKGRPSLHTPGRSEVASLREFRRQKRLQERLYEMTAALARDYSGNAECELPRGEVFAQLYPVVRAYITEKVRAISPAETPDAFLAPYYGWIIETLRENLRADGGAAPELPRYESSRGDGSTADVDFYSARELYPVKKSHINAMVADNKLETATVQRLDQNKKVFAFVKNEGLGFAIPYLHNYEPHEYLPDFILRLHPSEPRYLVLETKGYDPRREVKKRAAERWVSAVNADGSRGKWSYRMISEAAEVAGAVEQAAAEIC
ncbi:MAG: DEAD/DEAH box helicase family protein [Gammaproteobacteria bacterium]|nr:DEAD/DEAH box helicase family protein [Gammaproteobacteria bacterium]